MAKTDIGRAVPLLKGEYNPATTYELNDIVSLNGSLYWHYSHEETTNVAPQATSTWKVVLSLADAEAYIARAEVAAESAEDAAEIATAAKTAAESASTTATGASATATTAKNDAVTAKTAAETAQAGAVSAKNDAVTAKEAAQTAASSAGTSATNANNSAGTAQYYAESAGTSASTATTKASEASASASTASTAATTATTKASEASASATTATTKAGEASTSATSAASSAAAAQDVLDSIPEDYSALSEDVSDLKTHFEVYSPYQFTNGYYINYTNGEPVAQETFSYTVIPVSLFRGGKITGTTAISPNTNAGIAFHDVFGTYISGVHNTAAGVFKYDYDLDIPDNAFTVSITLRIASADLWVDPKFTWARYFENAQTLATEFENEKNTAVKSNNVFVPVLRNGTPGNKLNANSVTGLNIIPIHRYYDFLVIRYSGNYDPAYKYGFCLSLFENASDEMSIDEAIANSGVTKTYINDNLIQTVNNAYIVIPITTLEGYDHVGVTVFKKDASGNFVPIRIDEEQYCIVCEFRYNELLKADANYKPAFINGYYVNYLTGDIVAEPSTSYTEFPVSLYRSGKMKGKTGIAPNAVHGIVFYDAFGNYISGVHSTNTGDYNFAYDLTIPENASIVRITRRNESADLWIDPVFDASRVKSNIEETIGKADRNDNIVIITENSVNPLEITKSCTINGNGHTINVGSNNAYALYIHGNIEVNVSNLALNGGTECACKVRDGACVNFVQCEFNNASGDGTTNSGNGLSVANGNTNCVDCIADGNANDGFNYQPSGKHTVIGCTANNNGDDGISNHNNTTLKIFGGKYTGNGKAGIACPTYGGTDTEIHGAYIDNNTQYGLLIFAESVTSEKVFVEGCLILNNGTGAYVSGYQAILKSVVFSGNTTEKTTANAGTITEY